MSWKVRAWGSFPGLLPASGTTCEFVMDFQGKNESGHLPPSTRSVFRVGHSRHAAFHSAENRAQKRKERTRARIATFASR